MKIRRRLKSIKTMNLLRYARILGRVLESRRYSSERSLADVSTNNLNKWTREQGQLWPCIRYYIPEKSKLCRDRDETTNRIISECSKLALKEYKTRHDWVGNVIHRELCKKLKSDYSNKWYIHKHLSWRMRHTNSCEVLRYKRITKFRPDHQT